jgi:hypothetical protein
MGFPAVCAGAAVGINAVSAKNATATATNIGGVAPGKHRIFFKSF